MAAAPFALNGLPLRVMGRSLMTSSFSCDDISDRVLVLIQMHGGNDGLNTLIPLNQYSMYRNLRPVIGVENTGPRQYITLDSSLPSDQQIGLHPDLLSLKDMYDDGKVRLIQNVAYGNINRSHFRGTDIWLSGLDSDTIGNTVESGWWGRYLDHRFPNYPDAYPNIDMPDPPGLEFGSHIISLGFHRQQGIPMGLTLNADPTDFANAVLGSGTTMPDQFPNSDYGQELSYLVDMERSTNAYAQRLTDLYNQGANTPGVVYPDTYHTFTTSNYQNRLAPQLRTIARLLSGGCRTRIFLVRIGGFDTHEGQGIPDKPSFGSHGALLYHLSSAVKAFQEDLKGLGLEDRVLTVTFSEFGRTVAENSTYGTDHGGAAPMMVFGKGINPGVDGNNPNITGLPGNQIEGYEFDYRQVFATIVQDWLGGNNGTLDHAEFYQFASSKIDLINSNYVDGSGTSINYVADTSCDPTPDLPPPPPIDPVNISGFDVGEYTFKMGPNPATDYLTLRMEASRMMVCRLEIRDMQGRPVWQKSVRMFEGEYEEQLNLQNLQLSAGTYLVRWIVNPDSGFGQGILAEEKLIIR